MKQIFLLFSLFSFLFSLGITFGYSSEDLLNAKYLAKEAIVTSQTDVTRYRLDDKILRQEVIAIALKLKGITLPENYTCKKYYSDATKSDWVCRAVEIAADNGFISRENTKARPMDVVTRAEALAILLKAGKISLSSPRRVPQPDGTIWSLYRDLQSLGFTQWQADMLDSLPNCSLINHGVSCEDGASTNTSFSQFRPNTPALRLEVFEFAALMSGFIASEDHDPILDDLDILLPKTEGVSKNLGMQDSSHLSLETLKSLFQDEPIQTFSSSPKVALIVFSDLECPFCARFFQDTVAPIINDVSTQTALIYKHFPLSFHASSYLWAVESECIADALGGKAYFEYIHTRYINQTASVYDISPGLTTDQMSLCADDSDVAQRIQDEVALGALYAVTGTPTTLIVNMKTGYYEKIVGAYPKDTFDTTIQAVQDHQ